MMAHRYLSWENFRETVFLRGEQRVHRLVDVPILEVFGDGVGNRVGIWVDVPAATTVPQELQRLTAIEARVYVKDRRSILEIATSIPSLQRQFYHFANAVAERVSVENRAGLDAVRLELQCFIDLLEEKPLLGIEKQIGLIGELIFLQHLVTGGGIALLDSWVGPKAEPHDFRVEHREFEVKTTVAPHRIHTIHGTEQLVASKDCSLHLMSVLLGPPGASTGFSLASLVDSLSVRFGVESPRLTQFTDLLRASGFRSSDSQHYQREFTLRRPVAVIPIDEGFPTITRPMLQRALGRDAQRIEGLHYDMNVEGFEYEDGSPRFAQIVTGLLAKRPT
jgi:Putative  PD-(D/E)XK family member, (DUF4420)